MGWWFTTAASNGDRMSVILRLENVAEPKGRQSEQVARSVAKCNISNDEHDVCLYKRMIGYGIQ